MPPRARAEFCARVYMATSVELPRATVRAVVQQCVSARLQVKPPSSQEEDDAEYVEVAQK